jgi:subtilisin family serine protease
MKFRIRGIPRTRVLLFSIAAVLAAVGGAATPALAEPVPGHYIVTLKPDHDADAAAARASARPDVVYRSVINGFAAALSAEQLNALRSDPAVATIEPDSRGGVATTQAMDAAGEPWGLDRIDQHALPYSGSYGYVGTGAGTTVYVIDSGIETTHSEFRTTLCLQAGCTLISRAQNVYDALGGNGSDCLGHGTHVAGIIGGKTYGVAKGVQLRGVRVVDCYGNGTASQALAGVDWVFAHHDPSKLAVANMSLRYDPPSPALDAGVRKLIAGDAQHSGVFVAVAAGNESSNACHYAPDDDNGVSPARVMEAYTVAASAHNDARASFSNYAASGAQACVDIYAPGVDIKSAFLNNTTVQKKGTSMASPHVAGAGAILAANGFTNANAIAIMLNWGATNGLITGNLGNTPNRLLYKAPGL